MGLPSGTMLNMKVSTDRDQHQDMVNVAVSGYRNMGERRTATSVQGRGVRDSVVTTCAVMVYIAKYDFMVVVLKSEVKREDERAELRWKLWLSEKAILVWARLMEEMIKVGEIVGTVRSES